MTGKVTAQEIGKRVRKFRMAKGWSQKELGEKIGTSGQNIHKYENELYNFEVIQELSAALEVDLLKDEMDEEGEIGEIGLEILSIIAGDTDLVDDDEAGRIDADRLFSTDDLFGLSKEKRIHEIAKLEKIGLCVREQFEDFGDNKNDIIFITAKGVIALKRRMPADVYNYDKVKTYEMYCHDCDSIQDYIDSMPLEKELEKITFSSAFRYNFFVFVSKYLKRYEFAHRPNLENGIFNGISCYENILFSMMLNLTREEADLCALVHSLNFPQIIGLESSDSEEEYSDEDDFLDRVYIAELLQSDLFLTDEETELYEILEEKESSDYLIYQMGVMSDAAVDDVECTFMELLSKYHNEKYNPHTGFEEYDIYCENSLSEEVKRYALLKDERREKAISFNNAMANRIVKIDNIEKTTDIRKIFSKEQILSWVNANVRKPVNEHEEYLQHLMEENLRKYQSARNYFVFPKEWEEDGLADDIRKAYGVNEIMEKYPKEIVFAYDEPIAPPFI